MENALITTQALTNALLLPNVAAIKELRGDERQGKTVYLNTCIPKQHLLNGPSAPNSMKRRIEEQTTTGSTLQKLGASILAGNENNLLNLTRASADAVKSLILGTEAPPGSTLIGPS